MNLSNASRVRFNGSDIELIKLNGIVVYEVKSEEPGETLPYMVEYTVDNTITKALNYEETVTDWFGTNTYSTGLPKIRVKLDDGSFSISRDNYEAIEITLLDGSTTTDVTTTCNNISKVKLWYPENTTMIDFSRSSTSSSSSRYTSIILYNTSNFTSMLQMFLGCFKLTTINMSNCDTSKVTTMSNMFRDCDELTSVDMSNCDISNVTDLGNYIFFYCSALVDFKAPKNISVSTSFSDCTNLTHDSLMSIINNLKTVTSTQTLTLGSTNLAKLTDSEKAIATNKGWTLA